MLSIKSLITDCFAGNVNSFYFNVNDKKKEVNGQRSDNLKQSTYSFTS